nr:type II toxin-antitoxin system RelE/ParE family toxin [Rhizobium ruizarguesonis]
MPSRVLFAEEAERDIEDLYHFIAGRDGAETAEHMLTDIERAYAELEEFSAEIFRRNWRGSEFPNIGNCTISHGA